MRIEPKKKNKEKEKPMENITANIPEPFDEAIQLLKNLGLIASRSEAIRDAIEEFLKEEMRSNVYLFKLSKELLETRKQRQNTHGVRFA